MMKNVLSTLKDYVSAATALFVARRGKPVDPSDLDMQPVLRFWTPSENEDYWLFEGESEGAAHRSDMLAAELDRLSETLGSIRSVLANASLQPMPSAPYQGADAYVEDAFLFEGVEEIAAAEIDVFVEDAFLFEDDAPRAAPAVWALQHADRPAA